MSLNFYPILFTPIYKKVLTGGHKIERFGNRTLSVEDIDTSYELSDQENRASVVENGVHEGKTISELIAMDPKGFLGEKFNKTTPFPLSIKVTESSECSPVKVHPTDTVCQEIPNTKTKTKLNYIIDTESTSEFYVGLKTSITKHNFLSKLGHDVCGLLNKFKARRGDVYFIPAGRIYAMSGGNLVYDVSQNSSTSFTVHSKNDTPELALEREHAIQSIHFTDRMTPKVAGDASPITRNKKTSLVRTCPFFVVEELRLKDLYFDDTNYKTFHTLFSLDESFELIYGDQKVTIPKFRTVLIPAALGSYRIKVQEPTFILKTML